MLILNKNYFDALISDINSCTVQDSGVYLFVAVPPDSERIVLKIVTVSVSSKPIPVYIGDKIPVKCNAVTLNYIFKGLTQKWTVNNSYVIKNYGISSQASVQHYE